MSALHEYLAPLKAADIDTLLLGCTHYPLISSAISDYFGGKVSLVGAAESAVLALCESLGDELRAAGEGSVTYITSGDADAFKNASGLFLGKAQNGSVTAIAPFS